MTRDVMAPFRSTRSESSATTSIGTRIWWWGRSRLVQLDMVLRARGVKWIYAPRASRSDRPLVVTEAVDPVGHLSLTKNATHLLFNLVLLMIWRCVPSI